MPTKVADKSAEDKQAEPVSQDSTPADAMATSADSETKSSGPEALTTKQGGEELHDREAEEEEGGGEGDGEAQLSRENDCKPSECE